MATTAGRKYMSVIDAGASVGSVVASDASITTKAVSADELQYASEPMNSAVTTYLPGISGSKSKSMGLKSQALQKPRYRIQQQTLLITGRAWIYHTRENYRGSPSTGA